MGALGVPVVLVVLVVHQGKGIDATMTCGATQSTRGGDVRVHQA